MSENKSKFQKSYEDIFEFSLVADGYHKRAGATKFGHALKKQTGDSATRKKGLLSSIMEEYYDKEADINIDHASTDEKGNIIIPSVKGADYLYTKENAKKRLKAIRELRKKIIEITPIIADIPDDLTETEKEAFSGFIEPPHPAGETQS